MSINNLLPGAFETDRFRAHVEATAKSKGVSREDVFADRIGGVSQLLQLADRHLLIHGIVLGEENAG